jgi:hypothetical protein
MVTQDVEVLAGDKELPSSAIRSAAYTLRKQVWQTKSARFGAHRRLTAVNLWSTWTVAALTIDLIVTSLLLGTSVLTLTSESKELGLFLSIGITVLVLVLSLTEAARNYPLRADRLHRCAMELGAIWTRLDVALALDDSRLQVELPLLSTEYHRILQESAENHDEIDFRWFRAHHPDEFGIPRLIAPVLRMWYWLRTYGIYIVGLFGPFLLLGWFIIANLP